MTIIEVLKRFNEGATKGQASQGRVRIEGDKLYNYDTILAIRENDGIKMNSRKYSRTTSKLQTKIRCYCNVIDEFEGDEATIYRWGW